MSTDFVFDPHSREVDRDPFPLYEILRDEHPCYWSEHGDCWVLSRYQDIVDCNGDWGTFSSAQGNLLDDIPARTGVTLGTTDPPRHDRMRALIQHAFARRNLEYLVQPTRDVANEALDKLEDCESFDFIAGFSSPVTVGVLSLLLGIPRDQNEVLRRHVVNILQTDPVTRKKSAQSMASFQWLADYTSEQLEQRRQSPTEDLLTAMVQAEIDGEKLLEREVQMTSFTLIMAGVESASSFMAMLALNLCDHAQVRARVVEDYGLMTKAIEESLRYNTSAQRFCRTATRDVEMHGQTIKAGDKVLMCYGSGNRDDRQFEDPDVYNIDRPKAKHLGLGTGKHFCIGAPIVQPLVGTAMEEFLNRHPDYEQVQPQLDWIASTTFRSPVIFEIRSV